VEEPTVFEQAALGALLDRRPAWDRPLLVVFANNREPIALHWPVIEFAPVPAWPTFPVISASPINAWATSTPS
jgi:hypothetical protein